MRHLLSLFVVLALSLSARAAGPVRVVHAFVALCDNASQGIQKVPERIGNGDDPAANLYWGCSDGLRSVFKRHPQWKTVPAAVPEALRGVVLERLVFRHAKTGVVLVADAYRGREIRRCIGDYFSAAAGVLATEVDVAGTPVKAGGAADLVAYLGHDGLMEFTVDVPSAAPAAKKRGAIALCCVSDDFFGPKLVAAGAEPLVLTTQLMYPGAFILEAVLDGWMAAESRPALLRRAAAAYAKNQKISVKSAAGVFTGEAGSTPPL